MRRESELEQRQLDMDWYDAEEFGGTGHGNEAAANPFVGDEAFFEVRARALTADADDSVRCPR